MFECLDSSESEKSLNVSEGSCMAQREHTCFTPSSPGFESQQSRKFSEVNQRHWLEESGQLLENVDQTHLFLASGQYYKKEAAKGLKLTRDETRNAEIASKQTS